MIATADQQATPARKAPPRPGPWDDREVTLYDGSLDNRGNPVSLAQARRIVLLGNYEFYARSLRRRVTVEEYTKHIRAERRQGIKAGYTDKQVKDQFGELKQSLPAVTWSGRFILKRKADLITQHSGMIAADVDDLTMKQIESKWDDLCDDQHFWFLFRSPSLSGIKIVVPLTGLLEQWPVREGMPKPEYAAVANQFQYAAYFTLRKYMAETHGLQIDGACKDSSRLCYLPFDDQAHSNRDAKALEVAWSKDAEQQIDEERQRERQEAAQRREQAKGKGKSAPASPKASQAPAPVAGKVNDHQVNTRIDDDGPFQDLSDQEQECLVDACLDPLHPDVVPARFGASDNSGDRHRWDTSIGMAIHSWDSGDRGLERYLTWGQKSDHKDDEERERSWASFNGDGKITIGTLLSFARDAGVTMPWAGHDSGHNGEQKKSATINELLANHELIDAGKADSLAVRGLMEFADLRSDPNAVVLGDRWLLRKSAACVFAPAGVGKSTFVAQASVQWSLGEVAFGIKPARALKIVIFQAEDDDLDIREIVAGVKVLYQLGTEQCSQVNDNVKVVRTRKSGFDFFQEAVLPAVKAFQPDLIIVNPVMAFTDCDMLKQDEAAGFFRHILGEILESFDIAAILIHHTGKPSNTDLTRLNRYQEQYLGFGSSDLTNWIRATLMIWPTGVEGLFEFRASKRGEKIGWQVEKPGQDGVDQDEVVMVPTFVRLFKHWKSTTTVGDEVVEVTAWVEPEPGDEVEAAKAQQKRRGGRGRQFGPHDVVKHLPAHQAMALQQVVARVQAAAKARGVKAPSQRTVQRVLQEATKQCLVEHQGRGYTRLEAAK